MNRPFSVESAPVGAGSGSSNPIGSGIRNFRPGRGHPRRPTPASRPLPPPRPFPSRGDLDGGAVPELAPRSAEVRAPPPTEARVAPALRLLRHAATTGGPVRTNGRGLTTGTRSAAADGWAPAYLGHGRRALWRGRHAPRRAPGAHRHGAHPPSRRGPGAGAGTAGGVRATRGAIAGGRVRLLDALTDAGVAFILSNRRVMPVRHAAPGASHDRAVPPSAGGP